MEIMEPRFSSMRDAVIHFCLLDNGKMQDFEIRYKDSAEFYHAFVSFVGRYVFADIFRTHKYHTSAQSYRILIHKGVILDANNDLGGFVFRNNRNSYLISPYRKEIFERLRNDLLGYEDGVAQLVRVGLLLKNNKFCRIHNDYFGKIGLASLKDGSAVKDRYVDSVANNNVITDQSLFHEYLERVNSIPMSEFTAQSIVSKMSEESNNMRQVLAENYSNFLFADNDEMEFASILLGLFLHQNDFCFSTEEWVAGISYIRYSNGDTFLRTTEVEAVYRRNLDLYRANYVLDKIDLPKFVHFIYSFFDYQNLSQNIGTFYLRLNELLGEDIREKYLQLDTANISLKSFRAAEKPAKFFAELKLVNFSTAADREICGQIVSGNYDRDFVTYYLCNYMHVSDYKKYADVLPAALSIIKNLEINDDKDFRLFWMACDLLNEFWKTLPADDANMQLEMEKLIYDLFWPRIGDVWPIAHRNELKFIDECKQKTFYEVLGWLMSINNAAILNRELRSYLKKAATMENIDIDDPVEKKQYEFAFAKQKDHSVLNFVGDKKDEKNWWRAAIYCQEVSDVEICKSIIDPMGPLSDNAPVARYAFEQLLLKVRASEPALEIVDYMINEFAAVNAFWARVGSDKKNRYDLAIDALMALAESTSSDLELKKIKHLADKIGELRAEDDFSTKIRRALSVAEAQIRQIKFQTRDVTTDYIRKLR